MGHFEIPEPYFEKTEWRHTPVVIWLFLKFLYSFRLPHCRFLISGWFLSRLLQSHRLNISSQILPLYNGFYSSLSVLQKRPKLQTTPHHFRLAFLQNICIYKPTARVVGKAQWNLGQEKSDEDPPCHKSQIPNSPKFCTTTYMSPKRA
jgi:hypothetical protein